VHAHGYGRGGARSVLLDGKNGATSGEEPSVPDLEDVLPRRCGCPVLGRDCAEPLEANRVDVFSGMISRNVCEDCAEGEDCEMSMAGIFDLHQKMWCVLAALEDAASGCHLSNRVKKIFHTPARLHQAGFVDKGRRRNHGRVQTRQGQGREYKRNMWVSGAGGVVRTNTDLERAHELRAFIRPLVVCYKGRVLFDLRETALLSCQTVAA